MMSAYKALPLVNPTKTPSGVEQRKAVELKLIPRAVNPTKTPSGVEQTKRSTFYPVSREVNPTKTPSGVEQHGKVKTIDGETLT